MRPVLHPFQQRGAGWLADKRHAYLCDEMGLGKTAQALAALDIRKTKRALIVCPAIVQQDWLDAVSKFCPSRPDAHILTPGQPVPREGDLVVSYDRAVLSRAEIREIPYSVLICDEAHYLKNPTASRTRVILNPIQNGLHSLASKAGATWLLSGTPMPNSPAELWPALKTAGLVDGRYWDFVYRFCKVQETSFGRRIGDAKNVPELQRLLNGYMLRRMKADVLPEMPTLTVGTLDVEGAEIDASNPILAQLRELDEIAHDAISESIERGDWSMLHVPHIATIRRLTGLAKAARVVAQAHAELDTGMADKIVIFGMHTDVLKHFQSELREYDPILLSGQISPAKRRKAITEFQNGVGCRVAIGQIKAAGAGITLTASNRMLLAEAAWSPADNEQTIMRIHRIGQMRDTTVDYVSLKGSSDERVNQVLKSKIKNSREILGNLLTV
jgi:SWI/SNF-related matrix-associated actin-dependent regulator of chromatin subfamily A-like protein 1